MVLVVQGVVSQRTVIGNPCGGGVHSQVHTLLCWLLSGLHDRASHGLWFFTSRASLPVLALPPFLPPALRIQTHSQCVVCLASVDTQGSFRLDNWGW